MPLHPTLASLPAQHRTPCLSLYQSTHRGFPDNQQDPIRFRNLLKQLEASLSKAAPGNGLDGVVRSFQDLAVDERFWIHAPPGLAVFGAPGFFRVVRLRHPVPDLAVVADSFHVKPLLRHLQAADRYQILGLSLSRIRLFEAVGDAVEEIPPAPGVPKTLEDALGDELTDSHLTVAAYGSGASGPAMHHGHGSRRDEVDIDADRYFRAVDRAVCEHHSRLAGVPLLLAALPEHQSRFRKLSHNPHLMPDRLETDPLRLSDDALGRKAWDLMQPRLAARVGEIVDRFREARAHQRATDDVQAIAEAAIAGRVGTLLIDADQHRPGRIDRETGRVEAGSLDDPGVDDMLDDLAELVLGTQGEVLVVRAGEMPTTTGCAAIHRF
jgi:hypothetical protein